MIRRVALLVPLVLVTPAAARPLEQLALPIDCAPGVDCWVLRYVDHDPGPGVRDYMCGELTGDGHKGTDIAIGDLGRVNTIRGRGFRVGSSHDEADRRPV